MNVAGVVCTNDESQVSDKKKYITEGITITNLDLIY